MRPFRYAGPQIVVHWVAAVLVLFLLVTASLVLADLPNTADKIAHLRLHMILGASAGALIVARIAMRRVYPAPAPTPDQRLARFVHWALNAVVLLLAVSGTILAWQSGAFDAVFSGAALPEDFKVYTPRKAHGLLSRIAMGLVALHVLGALYHQLVRKDGLLSRMGVGAR